MFKFIFQCLYNVISYFICVLVTCKAASDVYYVTGKSPLKEIDKVMTEKLA